MIKSIIFGVLLLTVILLPFIVTYATAQILFEEVTEEAGLSYFGQTYGASWGDFNGDGRPDLWLGSHLNDSHKLFINNGSFYDISSEINLNSFPGLNREVSSADPHTGSWADFDNDGDQDLMIIGGGGIQLEIKKSPNVLLVNNDGFFEDKAVELGIEYANGRGRIPLWFDFNSDGFLDIFLVNAWRPSAPPTLFQNTGFGFEQVKSSGIKIENAVVVQTSHLFFNATQYLVSLVPNPSAVYDLGNMPANNIITKLNLKINNTNDLAIEDFNGDLLPDLFFTSMKKENPILEDKLFVNTGSEFVSQKLTAGVFNKKSCISIGTGDFDNDEDIDIYLVCTKEENLSNVLYENLGNGTFMGIPKAGGASGSLEGSGETVAVADYDGDGFLDLYVTNGRISNGPSHLFKNMGNENHWIKLDLIGTTSNKDGIGTRVLLTAGENSQIREQSGGMHYRAQNYKSIHFGLGQNKMVEKIIIYWPSGIVQELKSVKADQTLKIEENQDMSALDKILIGIGFLLVLISFGARRKRKGRAKIVEKKPA